MIDRDQAEAVSNSRAVVCGVDGSDGSFRAAAVAVELADRLNARLVLVHVVPPRQLPSLGSVPLRIAPTTVTDLRGDDRAQAETALASVQALVGLRPVQSIVERGDPAARLAGVAAAEEAALLVAGCLGERPERGRFLGSCSASLAAQASRPVLVVPDTVPPRIDRDELGAGTVVCGVDGSPPAIAAATQAARFATALETTLTLVCTDDPWTGDLAGARCKDILDAAAAALDASTRVEYIATVGNAARQLARVASERHATLIAVGANGHGRRGAGLLGSVATIVTGLARCPVLIVPRAVEASGLAATG